MGIAVQKTERPEIPSPGPPGQTAAKLAFVATRFSSQPVGRPRSEVWGYRPRSLA